MTDVECTQKLFGTADDGVLYLPGTVMKSAKFKPGDKLRITLDKDGIRVHRADKDPPPGGQP
ncbi:MAG: hypothetical protein ACREBU_06965 [Nitrososphaera sp.]